MFQDIEKLQFLTKEQVIKVIQKYDSPVFVYSQKIISQNCEEFLNFPNEFGLTVRFAMKANPNISILSLMKKKGICIDASSGFEAERAILAGFEPEKILISSQEFPKNLKSLIKKKVQFNACSLNQIKSFGEFFPKSEIGLRFNPGLGSGGTNKTNVGGLTSSFGIWYEELEEVKKLLSKYELRVKRFHTHIGSGTDPKIWTEAAKLTLSFVKEFPECKIVDLGGGYKVARMQNEKNTNLQEIGKIIKNLFKEHEQKYKQKLHLEIEPGTYLIANAGSLVCKVDDVVSTGNKGYDFVKLNVGMDSVTRPALYGSEHPIVVISSNGIRKSEVKDYVFTGHCCESGDIFTQKEGGELLKRTTFAVDIGDYVVLEGVGAYCSSMCLKNYNSFPELPEVLIDNEGIFHKIRKKQSLKQMMENEIKVNI